jgi:hypothetical protein
MELTHALGIYEVPRTNVNGQVIEDGIIDSLRDLQNTQLPPTTQFFGHSNNVLESQTFGFRTGSGFPDLDPGFLLSDEGLQFVGSRTKADVVIFGGAIAFDGLSRVDRRSGLRFRRDVRRFEPIFATIDLRTDANGSLVLADFDVGNIPSGLVFSRFHGLVETRSIASYAASYSGVASFGDVGTIRGEIKGARIGFGVTTTTGTILQSTAGAIQIPGAFLDIAAVEWSVPFHPDTQVTLN